MRKLLIGLAIFFTLLAIALSVLPFDTLAFLPIGLAITFGLLIMGNKKAPEISELFYLKKKNYLMIIFSVIIELPLFTFTK